jgi:hypothetical protein
MPAFPAAASWLELDDSVALMAASWVVLPAWRCPYKGRPHLVFALVSLPVGEPVSEVANTHGTTHCRHDLDH